jgi:hypothetical protein
MKKRAFFSFATLFASQCFLSLPTIDYLPVLVPNGVTAPYSLVGQYKVFHLIAEEISWEIAPTITVSTWGFNKRTPGPLIELCELDKVRIYVTNNLPSPITLHFEGSNSLCKENETVIPQGETYIYEPIFKDAGTFIYSSQNDKEFEHSTHLNGMIVVHKRELDKKKWADRDFALLLQEFSSSKEGQTPRNLITLNGKIAPFFEPLVADVGDRIWIRVANSSPTHSFSLDLQGENFTIIDSDSLCTNKKNPPFPETSLFIPSFSSKILSPTTNKGGDYLITLKNSPFTDRAIKTPCLDYTDTKVQELEKKIQSLIPEYSLVKTSREERTVLTASLKTLLQIREKKNSNKEAPPSTCEKNSGGKKATSFEMNRDKIYLLE